MNANPKSETRTPNPRHRGAGRWRARLWHGLFLAGLVALGLTSAPDAGAETIQVSISCGPNGDIAPKGTLTLPAGANLDVTATPMAGYQIEDWYVDGQHAGWSVEQQHFAFGDADVSIYVAFERITNRVVLTVGNGGTVQPAGNNGVLLVGWSDSVTFTAQPDPTYHADTWTVDGIIKQVGGNSFTLRDVTAEHSVAVDFAVDTFAILSRAGPHGSVDPEGVVSVGQGYNQPFTATANLGFSLAGWLLDGAPAQTGPEGYVLVNVQTNHAVQPLFSLPIACGQTVTNELVSAPDPDVWLFNGQAGNPVFISLAAVSSNLAPVLSFYAPDGQWLAESDTGTANLTLANSGDFLILVHDAQYANTGEYVLSVNSSPATPPALKLQRAGPALLLSWPSSFSSWRLQQCSNLAAESWSDCGGSIADDGTNCTLTLFPQTENLFFRLAK